MFISNSGMKIKHDTSSRHRVRYISHVVVRHRWRERGTQPRFLDNHYRGHSRVQKQGYIIVFTTAVNVLTIPRNNSKTNRLSSASGLSCKGGMGVYTMRA